MGSWSLLGNTLGNPGQGILGTNDNNPLVIETYGTERLRVDSSGNVGINTADPQARLSVNGKVVIGSYPYKGDASLQITDALGLNRLTQMQPYPNNQGSTLQDAINIMASMNFGVPQWWSWGVRYINIEGQNYNVWSIQPGLDFNGSTGLFVNSDGQVVIGAPYKGDASLHITQGSKNYNRLTQLSPANPGDAALNIIASNDSSGMAAQWWAWGVNNGIWSIQPDTQFSGTPFSPTQPVPKGLFLNQAGDLQVSGTFQAAGADCAEDFDVAGQDQPEPGSVVVIDEGGALRESQQAYDKKVAGVVSGAGDYRHGLVLDRRPSQEARIPIALAGKVFCKVDAEYSPVAVGDLLTTSPTPGYAMKAGEAARAFGSVLGKALGTLQGGRGLVPILVTLQ